MPDVVYQIVGRNGVTYRISGPEGRTREQIQAEVLRRAPEAGIAPYGAPPASVAAPAPAAPAEQQSEAFLRGRRIRDTNLLGGVAGDALASFNTGVWNTTGGVAALTGAGAPAAEYFRGLAESNRGQRTDAGLAAERRGAERRAAAEGDLFREIVANVRSVGDDPVGSVSSVLGSVAASVPALLASLDPRTRGAGAVYGAASGLGAVKSGIYEAVYDAEIANGATEAEARERATLAQSYTGPNVGSLYAGTGIGAAAGSTGVESAVTRALAPRVAREAATRATVRGTAAGVGRGAAVEAIPEGVQEGQERLASNLALQNAGFDVDTWRGVAGQAALGSTLGALMGGPAGGLEYAGEISANRAVERRKERAAENEQEAALERPLPPTEYESVVTELMGLGLPREVAELAAVKRGFSPPTQGTEDAASVGQPSGAGVSGPDVRGGLGGTATGPEGTAAGDVGGARGASTVDVQGQSDVYGALARRDPATQQVLSGVFENMPDNFTERQQGTAMAAAEYALTGAAFDTAPLTNLDEDTRAAVDYGTNKANELFAATRPLAQGENLTATAAAELAAPVTQTPTAPTVEAEAAKTVPDVVTPSAPKQRAVRAISPEVQARRDAAAAKAAPAPVLVQGDVVTEGPRAAPRGFLWDTPVEDLQRMREEAAASDSEKLVMALGKEGAAEFKRLDRARNSADPQRADTASAKFDARFGSLTPDQERLVYGIGEDPDAPSVEDLDAVIRAHSDVMQGDDTLQAAYMGAVGARNITPEGIDAVTRGEGTAAQQAAFVRLQNARDAFAAQGVADGEIPARMARALVDVGGWKPEQANEIIGGFMRAFEARAVTPRAASLEAPTPTPTAAEAAPTAPDPDAIMRAIESEALADIPAGPVQNAFLSGASARLFGGEKDVAAALNKTPEALRPVVQQGADIAANRLAAPKAAPAPKAATNKLREAKQETRSAEAAGSIVGGTVVDIDAFRGSSFPELLNHVARNKSGKYSEFDAQLADKLNILLFKLQDAGFSITLNVVQEGDKALPTAVAVGNALAMVRTDLRARTVDVYFRSPTIGNSGDNTETILHEALHAVSEGILLATENGRGTPEMVKFREDLINLRNKVIDHFNSRVKSVGKEGLTDFELSIYTRSTNAFVNVSEFLAWGMTNKLAQDYLRSIEVGPKKSLFSQFVEAFRSLLGISPNDTSALAHLVDIINPLFNMTEQDYRATIAKQDNTSTAAMAATKPPAVPKAPKAASTPVPLVPKTEAEFEAVVDKAINTGSKNNDIVRKLAISMERGPNSTAADVLGSAEKGAPQATAKDILVAIANIGKTHNADAWVPALKTMGTNIPTPTLKRIVVPLPTSGLVGWVGDKVPQLREVNKLMQLKLGQIKKFTDAASGISKRLSKFANKNGQDVLSYTANLGAMTRVDIAALTVDPSKSDNANIAINVAADPAVQFVNAQLPNALPDRRKALLAERTKRIKNEIEPAYRARVALGKQKGGLEAYKEIRSYLKNMLATQQALSEAGIRALGLSKELEAGLLNARASFAASEDATSLIPNSVYPDSYMPALRFGDYWLIIEGDQKSGRERMVFMRDSASERDNLLREIAEEYNLNPNDGDVIRKGSDPSELQTLSGAGENALIKVFFEAIDKAQLVTGDGKQLTEAEAKKLKDDVVQTYLQGTSERSLTKRFLHSKNVAGRDFNIIRVFNTVADQYSRMLAGKIYNDKIDMAVDAAQASLASMPPSAQEFFGVFITEMRERVSTEYSAGEGAIAAAVNRITFFMLLSSIASGLNNATFLPLRTFWALAPRYGYAKTAAKFAEYFNFYNSVGVTSTDPLTGERVFTWPSMRESALFRNRTIRKRLYAAGDDRAVYTSQAESILTPGYKTRKATGRLINIRKNDPLGSLAETFVDAVARVGGAALEATSTVFSAADVAARKIAFMVAAELEYEKSGNFDAAVDKGVAVTNDTGGNYQDFERPRFMKGDVGRSLSNFKMFPLNTTRWQLTNLFEMTKGGTNYDKSLRSAAIQEFVGATLTGFAIHGLRGTALFSVVCSAIGLVLKKLADDDDLRKAREDNPLYNVYDNTEKWLLHVWLPSRLGEPSVEGPDGRMHTLANIIEYGAVSELTNVNVGSRTGINNLWFTSGQETDASDEALVNFLVSNVPGMSMSLRFLRGVDDIKNGEVLRGLTQAAPALVRGVATQEMYRKQGLENTRGKVVMASSEFSAADRFWAAVGFQPTAVADAQAFNFDYNSATAKARQDRTKVLDNFYRVGTDVQVAPGQVNAAWEKINKHNERYPNGEYTITPEDLMASMSSRLSSDETTVRGIRLQEDTLETYLRLMYPQEFR